MKKIGLVIAVFVFLLLFFIPNILEYYIEQQDQKFIGRELILDDIDINYLTGELSIESLYILEQNARDTFAGFELFEVDFGMWSSISGEYSLESLHLVNPLVHIVEYDSIFNFSDLIPTPDTTTLKNSSSKNDVAQYQLEAINIHGLRTTFTNKFEETIEVDLLNVSIDPFSWNDLRLKGDLFVSLLKGGEIATTFELDINSGEYQSTVKANDIALPQFSHLIRPFLDFQNIDGTYSNNLSLNGNYLKDTTDLTIRGNLQLDNFKLLDKYSIEQIAFESLYLDIDSIDMQSNQYNLKELALNTPTINYALYPNKNSFSEIFYIKDSLDSGLLSDSVKTPKDTSRIHYNIDKIRLTNGSIGFNDFTLINNFTYNIDVVNIAIDSLNSTSPQFESNISALVNYLGELKTTINFDLNDPKNFAYSATIDSVLMRDFSPYSIEFVGNPITKGALYFEGSAATSAHFLKSDNRLTLDQLKLGEKFKHKERNKLPVKTAVGLLKNNKGEIKIKLPIRGNLDDPSFKVWRTVLSTFKNLVIKTVSSPLTAVGKVVTAADKDINEISYDYLQVKFNEQQKSLIKNISRRTKGHKTAVLQYTNSSKEKAAIALFEAKKQFYKSNVDSIEFTFQHANNILPIDSSFQKFVNNNVPQDSIMSLIEKCYMIVGSEEINTRFDEITTKRNQQLKSLFTKSDDVEVVVADEDQSSIKLKRPVFKIVKY